MTAAVRSPSPGLPKLRARWLGRVGYREAWDLQRALFDARVRDEGEDYMLLVEHPHTYTCGRRTDPAHLLRTPEEYAALGAEVVDVDRGGDVTYHGPGQLVGYPILDLGARTPDVHLYLRTLERLLIAVLGEYGIEAIRRDGYAGVWLDERRKIASIGVGLRRWLTMHGFALNVNCDLRRFDAIVPCGLANVRMVSMASVLGREVSFADVVRRVERELRSAFP